MSAEGIVLTVLAVGIPAFMVALKWADRQFDRQLREDLAKWRRRGEAWRVRPLRDHLIAVEVNDLVRELAITPAHPVNPRRDLIVESPLPSGDRIIRVINGTPGPLAIAPPCPPGRHPIAVLFIPPGAMAIREVMVEEP